MKSEYIPLNRDKIMLRKISPICLVFFIGLTSCASVTEKIPTVKIERKKPNVIKTVNPNYQAPNVQQAEAAMVCENDNMRNRSTDKNMKNDLARVLILEEGGRSSNVIADVEVNCRDYFQSKQYNNTRRVVRSHPPMIVSAPTAYTGSTSQLHTSTVQQSTAPAQPKVLKTSWNVQAAAGYYYSIKKGDTLYRIAQDNCSNVDDISTLNGITDPAKIEIHQIIRLPAQKCNARN